MKKNNFWRLPNAAQLLVTLLLLAGILLAWWIERAHRGSAQRGNLLISTKDRIYASVTKIGDGIQGLVLDPKSDLAVKRGRDGANELSSSVESLETAFAGRTDLIAVARKLQALSARMLEPAENDPATLAPYLRKNYAGLQEERERLLLLLDMEIKKVADAEAARGKSAELAGLGGIIVLLIAGVLIVWYQSSALAAPLSRSVDMLERMRRGDFTQRLALDGSEDFNELGGKLNGLAEDLSALVGQVQRSGIQVNATATHFAATAKEQQTTAHEIAATTAEIGATSRQISATSQDLVKTIDEVTRVAEDAARLANSGQAAIGRMESTMRQIMEASGGISAKLGTLSEKTANINTMVTTITKVADQTNLLSLNAAIEAEKAGEYGLGFAVVAMEIRRLADQTAVATYDIEKSVKEMQSAVAAGVMGLDKFSDEVRRGVEEIRQVSSQLAQIIHQVQTLTPRFQMVNEGMHAQSAGAQQISETLTQLSEAARQTAESLRQSNLAIDQLNEAARGLQSSVGRLKPES